VVAGAATQLAHAAAYPAHAADGTSNQTKVGLYAVEELPQLMSGPLAGISRLCLGGTGGQPYRPVYDVRCELELSSSW
jgi:hypothetical protein